MFWPLVLPIQITLWLLIAGVSLALVCAARFRWNLRKTALWMVLVPGVAFVPSCCVIEWGLNTQRFGLFEHDTYAEVKDFRVERHLPPGATDIKLEKYPNRNRAKYKIAEERLTGFLEGLWDEFGDRSAVSRDDLDIGKIVRRAQYAHFFDGLNWNLPDSAIKHATPVEPDGGGATYYYNRETGTAYHHGGYW